MSRLADHAESLRDGDLDEQIRSDRVDEFGDLFETFDVMRESLRRRVSEAEAAKRRATQAKREAEAARAVSEARSERLVTRAEAYGDVMAACAEGDLDRRIAPDDDSAAMATIAESFNAMMDDLQRQNDRLETVSGVLSHDLRNPLTVAKGRAELVGDDHPENPHVAPMLDALERMDAIVDDALLLARGTRVGDTRRVDVDTRARTAWKHVDTAEATLDVESGTVVADPNLLDHVFENLFRNAVEHGRTTDDESLTVEVRTTATGFAVEDDGTGISGDERDTVFEAGYTTNREDGGTGFGLAIVSRVADVHGWGVSVVESDDGGARFRFDGVERGSAATDGAPSVGTEEVSE